MAIYLRQGTSTLTAVGWKFEDHHFHLCVRAENGECRFFRLDELEADGGLPELAAAFAQVSHDRNPWQHKTRDHYKGGS